MRSPDSPASAQRQDVANQLLDLERYAKGRGWVIHKVYPEYESAGEGVVRPVFRLFMDDARMHRFDVALFWSLDRFSREGVLETLQYLQQLSSSGVAFVSYQEQYLDSAGLFKDAIIAILAALAKQERHRLSNRVKAGIARRKEKGLHTGRKPKGIAVDALRLAVEARLSARQMATLFSVSKSAAHNYATLFRNGEMDELARLNALATSPTVEEVQAQIRSLGKEDR
jgi:DNA invertase Pin-like site-specific DNA recombinase